MYTTTFFFLFTPSHAHYTDFATRANAMIAACRSPVLYAVDLSDDYSDRHVWLSIYQGRGGTKRSHLESRRHVQYYEAIFMGYTCLKPQHPH
ncbi:hypothetical protein BJ166DRAFT_178939 [Pestalotiopsis sp. NC0098]|nr:hypothetical protein BJ166DRAFT_178939 [Pestalotiopsis sp. NC0098]